MTEQQTKSIDKFFHCQQFNIERKRISCENNNIKQEQDISFDQIQSLIDRLIPSDSFIPTNSLIHSIILCCRLNLSPILLFNQLISKTIQSIQNQNQEQILGTLRNLLFILSQWINEIPSDFRHSEMIEQLKNLILKLTNYDSSFQITTKFLEKTLHFKLKILNENEFILNEIRKMSIEELNRRDSFSSINFLLDQCSSTIELAEQLTIIELDRLKSIGCEELIQYFIMKFAFEEEKYSNSFSNLNEERKSDLNPNHFISYVHDKKLTFFLEYYIQWFNRLTLLITKEIVQHRKKRFRINLINYFIDTAYQCFRLKNYNSMFAILGGLNLQPIRRLKQTWNQISMEKFLQLEQYLDISKNFSNYRLIFQTSLDEAKKTKQNYLIIPFFSLILQDIYFIETHSNNLTFDGQINIQKYQSLTKLISEQFYFCQQSKCSFSRNSSLINYLLTSPILNEDSLMLSSFECESAMTSIEKENQISLKNIVKFNSIK